MYLKKIKNNLKLIDRILVLIKWVILLEKNNNNNEIYRVS